MKLIYLIRCFVFIYTKSINKLSNLKNVFELTTETPRIIDIILPSTLVPKCFRISELEKSITSLRLKKFLEIVSFSKNFEGF